MTAARHRGKPRLRLAGVLGVLILVGISIPVGAQTLFREPLVINGDSGLVISGYDPVAYFSDGKAVAGRPQFELMVSGTIWRFRNEGNRAAFQANPEVYAPRFGGYDPVAIGRGSSVEGHPLLWAIVGERLYLFYNEAHRATFQRDPGRHLDAAERRWPEVARTLGR